MSERQIDEKEKFINEGIDLIESKNYSNATIKLNNALKLDPNDEYILYLLGLINMRQENFDQAVSFYEKAIQIYPQYHAALTNLGYSLHQVGKLQEAFKTINLAIELKDEANLHYLRAKILQDLKNLNEALDDFKIYLNEKPDDIEVLGTTGRLLEDLRRYEEALGIYNQITDIDPDLGMAYYDKVVVLKHLGRYVEAVDVMDKVLVFSKNGLLGSPTYIDLLKEKGNLFFKQENYEKAISFYDEVLKLVPNDEKALILKIESFKKSNNHDKAIELIDQIDKKVKNPSMFLEEKLAILRSLERYQDVINLADQLIKLEPKNAYYADSKSIALEKLHRIDDSIHALDEFLKINPNHLGTLERKLRLLRRNNKMKEGEKTLFQIRKIAESLPDTGENYSKAIIITGNTDPEGTEKVYRTLDQRFGERQKDWFFERQTLQSANGRAYDKMDIKLANNEKITIYFDITNTFGKF